MRPLITQSQPNPSSPPIIFRRLPASSSFVLAAARLRALQLDPGRAAARPGAAARKDPEEQSAQPGRQDVVTGPGPHALLTPMALMGADVSAFGAVPLSRPWCCGLVIITAYEFLSNQQLVGRTLSPGPETPERGDPAAPESIVCLASGVRHSDRL